MNGPTVKERSKHVPAEDQSPDGILVERLKAYDEDAIRQVYRLYSDAIYRYALYQSGDRSVAEDVAGEVFVRMMESIGTYAYRGWPISAWLYRIARNLIVDHQRRGNRLTALEESDDGRVLSLDPQALAESELSWLELRALLSQLTEEQSQVIVLRFIDNLDNAEIAEITGRSVGSVKALQHRALRSLRKLIERQAANVRSA